MKKRVLLIDDDRDVLELLEYNLSTQGYKVKCVDNAGEAVKKARNFTPDLMVLDILMPNITGLEICAQLRKVKGLKETPLFFLTALTDSAIVQLALMMGGDDLIHKTMGLRSLIMKINAVLKEGWIIRKRLMKFKLGSVAFDRNSLAVRWNKREILLSEKEFEIFFFLAQNPTKAISSQNIRHHIWGPDIFHFPSPLEGFVERICAKFGANLILETKEDHYQMNSKLI